MSMQEQARYLKDRAPVVCLDLDGTIVKSAWPDLPQHLLPGAALALRELHEQGVNFVLFSARLSPLNPDYTERAPGEQMAEVQKVQDLLDREGVGFIDIFLKPGKPSADLYLDDKGMWFPGTNSAWTRGVIPDKIRTRLGLKGGDD